MLTQVVNMSNLVNVFDIFFEGLLDGLLAVQQINLGDDLQARILWPERIFLLQRSIGHSNNTIPDASVWIVVQDLVDEGPSRHAACAPDQCSLSHIGRNVNCSVDRTR